MGCSAAITDHRPPGSSLDRLIPPGIKDDKSYRAITGIAATPGVRQVLRIGASSGGSSTDDVLRFRSAAGVQLFDAALDEYIAPRTSGTSMPTARVNGVSSRLTAPRAGVAHRGSAEAD